MFLDGAELRNVRGGASATITDGGAPLSLIDPTTRYFPGDPPVAEVIGILGALIFVPAFVLCGVALVARRYRLTAMFVFALFLGPLLLGTAALSVAAVDIGRRHFGEWSELKGLLSRYAELVRAQA